MNKHSTIMASLLRGFPRFEFQSIVNEYSGDKKIRSLSTYHMLTSMLYGQTTSAFGMREIVKTLEANRRGIVRSCGLKRKSISFGRTNTNHFTEGRICSCRSLSQLKA